MSTPTPEQEQQPQPRRQYREVAEEATHVPSPSGGGAERREAQGEICAAGRCAARKRTTRGKPLPLRAFGAPPHFSATTSPKMLTPLGEESNPPLTATSAGSVR